MRKIFLAVVLSLCIASFAFADVNPSPRWLYSLTAVQDATQVIIIAGCPDNQGRGASFTMHEKDGDNWHEVISCHAFIGKNGWGKRFEGDGKTPCGEFRFTKAFGINRAPSGCQMDYTKVDEADYWNGDSDSLLYNKFVSTNDYTDFEISKSEHIIDYNMAYRYALNISWNPLGKPNRGSAIFLHCYTTKKFTGGCVAIPESVMVEVLRRVEDDCVIIMDKAENIQYY